MMGSTIILTDTLSKMGYVCMDMMGNKIAMQMPLDEMENEEAVSDMQIKYINETKMVAGYTCKKAIITMKVEEQEILQTVWYCEEIQNTNRDMYKLKGMPMEYDMDMQGMHVNYVVSNVSKEKIPDTMFDVPAGYTVTTQEDLNNLIPAMEGGDED
jgi:GLPGLI family protein